MFRSVSWRLVLNSLFVAVAALLAVGSVTLFLANDQFSRREEQYLRDRGEDIVRSLEAALKWDGEWAEIQQIASFGLFTSHVRVRVTDSAGRLLADSGTLEELVTSVPVPFADDLSEAALQIVVDRQGRAHGFRPWGAAGVPILSRLGNGTSALITSELLPPVDWRPQLPIREVADVSVRLPLYVNGEIVGFTELSEGPAVGQAIRTGLLSALLVGSLFALILAALVGLASARQVTRPLGTLGRAADEMAGGRLEARAPRSRLVEFDRLAMQFNSMADQLTQTIASLEADRAALRNLIADASHELRTPLTALKTFNELLSREPGRSSEPSATFLKESGFQLAQLDRLTSDLLDLSRLEARISGTNLVSGDIRPVIERAIQAHKSLTKNKEQNLILDAPNAPVTLPHDAVSLERAVNNLIGNAHLYTPRGGTVLVKLRQREATAVLEVRDDGPGIPESEQPFVFERFYRGRGEASLGSGLGLAICREIVSIHRGRIRLQSREGKGSTFTIELPLTAKTN